MDAQDEGTTTCTMVVMQIRYARDAFRPGRAVMHASISVEYECDVFTYYKQFFEPDIKTFYFAFVAGPNKTRSIFEFNGCFFSNEHIYWGAYTY